MTAYKDWCTMASLSVTYGKILGLILLCGGVLYYVMDSKLSVKLTIAQSPVTFKPRLIDELVLKLLQNKTDHHSEKVQPTGISPEFNNVPEYSVPSIQSNQTILSKRKMVLIVAYMRTGSTLTASLLQEYPGTFYAFEPIRSVFNAFNGVKKSNMTHLDMKYLHNVKRKYHESEEWSVIHDEINAWLTCQLDSLSIDSLTDVFHKHYTKIMKNFFYCFSGNSARAQIHQSAQRIHPQLRHYYNSKRSIDTCLKSSINSCKISPLVVLKFIRIRMREVIRLLPFYPNMKIIHLVRDPRGILNSRLKTHLVGLKKYEQDVSDLCHSLNDDLVHTKALFKTIPDKIKILHYEDMAERPMEVAEEITKFVGINLTQSMQTFIRKQTSSTRDSCNYCTQRKNSTATAYKWRTQLKTEQAMFIYNTCKTSNEVLGYLPLSSKVQSDPTAHSRKFVDTRSVLLSNQDF